MEGGESKSGRTLGIWIASLCYVASGLYVTALSFPFDSGLLPFYVLSALSVVAGVGMLLMNRWAALLAIALFPPMIAVGAFGLNYSTSISGLNPNWEVLSLNLSLVAYIVFLVFSLLLILDSRKRLK